MRQDYAYLVEFARVLAWAAAKADRLESMAWYADALGLTLNTEMDLHRGYAAQFGLSTDQLEREPMWPTTRAYTDFLARTAADGDMADLLAPFSRASGVTPMSASTWPTRGSRPISAMRSGSTSTRLTSSRSRRSGFEARWTVSPSGTTADKRRRLTDLVLLSSRYEWRFWEMCWKGEQWPV